MVINWVRCTRSRLLGVVLKLYLSNMQLMLNRDVTRYMQSLSRNAKIEQSKSSASRVYVTIYCV